MSLVILGTSLLLHQITPNLLTFFLLILSLVFIFFCTAVIAFRLLRGLSCRFGWEYLFFSLFFVVGIFRSIGLPLARLIQEKPGLIWSVDWAFSLGHAQNIYHTETLDNSISYVGSSEAYHIGPSYLAGLLSRCTNLSVDFYLLILFPIATYTFFYFFIYLYSYHFSRNVRVSQISCFLFSILPGATFQDFRFLGLENFYNITTNHSLDTLIFEYFKIKPFFLLMHNSQLGLIISFAVIYLILLLNPNKLILILSSISTVSIFTIKPHFAVAVVALILSFLVYTCLKIAKYQLTFNIFSTVFSGLDKDSLNARKCIYFLTTFTTFYIVYKLFNLPSFYPTHIYFGYFIDSLKALTKLDFPLMISSIRTPLYHIFQYIISSRTFYLLISCMLVFIYRKKYLANYFISNLKIYVTLYLVGIVIIFISLYFPISYTAQLPNPISEGIIPWTDDSLPLGGTEYQVTEIQLEIFTSIGLSLIFCLNVSLLLNYALSTRKNATFRSRLFTILIPLTLSILEINHAFSLIVKPDYLSQFSPRSVDDFSEYKKVLSKIPDKSSIILTNEVSRGFKGRAFRATHLSAFTPHFHYLSNVADYHWRSQPDVLYRLSLYNKIFNKTMIDCGESSTLLKDNGITHLIIFKDNLALPISKCSNFFKSYNSAKISLIELQ